jgi:hypothetical protein
MTLNMAKRIRELPDRSAHQASPPPAQALRQISISRLLLQIPLRRGCRLKVSTAAVDPSLGTVHTYIEYVHARPEFDEILFQLSNANQFTADDLDANRQGLLGGDQTRKHLAEAFLPPLLVLAAGTAFSFLTRIAFAGYVEKLPILDFTAKLLSKLLTGNFRQFFEMYLTTSGERLPMIVALFVITAPMTAYKKLRCLPVGLLLDLGGRRVKVEEGSVSAVMEEVKAPGHAGRRGDLLQVFYYVVNDKKIKVDYDGYQALTVGLRYRVYYLPRSKHLASIEPVIG